MKQRPAIQFDADYALFTTDAFNEPFIDNLKDKEKKSKPFNFPLLLVLFALAITLLYCIYRNIPAFESHHRARLKVPTNLQDVKDVSEILSLYTNHNYYSVLGAFGSVYIFLQAFSIPGSVFLSFLGGALFGVTIGVPFVCLMATIGATCSYLLSYYICRNLVKKFFPEKLAIFAGELSKHRSHLFNYILFLRITPFLPNWFINLSAPILGVPTRTFVIGTFWGVMPATYFAVKAGMTMQNAVELKGPKDIFDATAIISLFLLATASVLPTLKPVQNFMSKMLNH